MNNNVIRRNIFKQEPLSIKNKSFSDDLINEQKLFNHEVLRGIESRLKRHITECKREVIKKMEELLT